MLKKIQSFKEAEELKSGDIIYDDFREGGEQRFQNKIDYWAIFAGFSWGRFSFL